MICTINLYHLSNFHMQKNNPFLFFVTNILTNRFEGNIISENILYCYRQNRMRCNSILIYNDDIGVLQPRWSGISSKIFHKSRRVDLSKKNSLSLRLCFPLQRSLRIKYVYIQFKLLFSGKIRIRLKRHLDNLFRFYRPLSTAQYYKERFEQF